MEQQGVILYTSTGHRHHRTVRGQTADTFAHNPNRRAKFYFLLYSLGLCFPVDESAEAAV